MELTEFVEAYLKERDLKLMTHQKGMLKSIAEGKILYYSGERSHGKSVLADALKAYEESREGIENGE